MKTSITIIEQISSTEVIVRCARCKGTGRVWPNDSDSKACWICNGKGQLLLEVERLPLVECARCEGTGRTWPNDSDSSECNSCEGAGCQPIAGEMRIIK
jgi:DnaJ-class molecular chaperone